MDDFRSWARKAAISTHDKKSAWFERQYRESMESLDSSFLYGRFQINRYFHHLISQLPKGAKVLDVGCGTGEQILQLQPLGFQVSGVEPSAEMRKYAESKLPAGTVLDASILGLPFPEGTFDFVYAIEVLRYLNNEDNLSGLREIRRVLKPGGIFFGTFVNLLALDGFSTLTILRKLLMRLSRKGLARHTEMTTPGRLRKQLLAAEFTDIEIHGAMIAPLRIIYRVSPGLGRKCGRVLSPIDPYLTDFPGLRALAGHCLAWARK